MIAEATRVVLPDIKYSVGWHEAGIETICFFSQQGNKVFIREIVGDDSKIVDFLDVLLEVFPELVGHVDAPYGIYLYVEDANKLREVLKKLRKGEDV